MTSSLATLTHRPWSRVASSLAALTLACSMAACGVQNDYANSVTQQESAGPGGGAGPAGTPPNG